MFKNVQIENFTKKYQNIFKKIKQNSVLVQVLLKEDRHQGSYRCTRDLLGETLVQDRGGSRKRQREVSNHNVGLIPMKEKKRIDTDKVSEIRTFLRKIQLGCWGVLKSKLLFKRVLRFAGISLLQCPPVLSHWLEVAHRKCCLWVKIMVDPQGQQLG